MRASATRIIVAVAGIFALSFFSNAPGAQAQSGGLVRRNEPRSAARSLARRPDFRVAPQGAMVDGDTIFVGWTPGKFNATDNWWSIGAGYGPGFHRPPASGGMWDWETPLSGDSLNGWWPIRLLYQETGNQTLADRNRPWWALDYGNQANYVINQGAGQKRTFGVVGVWHVDAGNLAPGGANGVTWAPLAGTSSAWMGLRRHGDNQYVDPITSNPFNEDALQFNGANSGSASGNDKGFPGYGSQMDQMLYRDIDISGANPDSVLKVYFKLRTRMSSSKNTANATRTGWFDKDPLSDPALNDGNFISSTDAGANAPIDSFMVYVGCPVGDAVGAEWLGSDGLSHQVFDPVRRWFGELIRANEPDGHRELFTTWGDRDSMVCSMIPLSALASWGDTVRVVFRVKTNRGFDDEDTLYSSGGAGAAVVDDVTYQIGSGSVVSLGTFESPNAIDNSTSVSALDAWKSTGKPPGTQEHVERLENLIYQDINGPPGSPTRVCNMIGGVISAGNHDLSEATGGAFGTADQELVTAIVSPTIQLCGPYDRAGGTNAQGLTASNIIAADDYYVDFDIYDGLGFCPDVG